MIFLVACFYGTSSTSSETVVVNIGAMGGEKVSPTCHDTQSTYSTVKTTTLDAPILIASARDEGFEIKIKTFSVERRASQHKKSMEIRKLSTS